MANVLSSILMLLIVSRIKNLDITKTESLSEGKVNLLGDNNLYLARCNSCGTAVTQIVQEYMPLELMILGLFGLFK